MRALYEQDNYLGFGLSSIPTKVMHDIMKEVLHISHTISVEEMFDCEEIPTYTTQIAYFSGYIQNRYVYNINLNLCEYFSSRWKNYDMFNLSLSSYYCWDFYLSHTLVLSINIVNQTVFVNTDWIDLSKFGYKSMEGGNHE